MRWFLLPGQASKSRLNRLMYVASGFSKDLRALSGETEVIQRLPGALRVRGSKRQAAVKLWPRELRSMKQSHDWSLVLSWRPLLPGSFRPSLWFLVSSMQKLWSSFFFFLLFFFCLRNWNWRNGARAKAAFSGNLILLVTAFYTQQGRRQQFLLLLVRNDGGISLSQLEPGESSRQGRRHAQHFTSEETPGTLIGMRFYFYFLLMVWFQAVPPALTAGHRAEPAEAPELRPEKSWSEAELISSVCLHREMSSNWKTSSRRCWNIGDLILSLCLLLYAWAIL